MNKMTKALEKMYRESYANDTCKYDANCSEGLCRKHVFRYYKAKLGASYGEDGFPRLMFIGKEPPTEDTSDLSKLAIDEPAKISCVPNNNYHYFGTIYTAARILKRETPPSPSRADLLKYEELNHFFCLTNYFKCVFKESENNSGVNVSKGMKNNCYHLLMGEIETLRPEIIVVQGKFTNQKFWKALEGLNPEVNSVNIDPESNGISATQYHYSDGTPFFVIWGYHPCARGRKWYNSLNDINHAIDVVCDLWKQSIMR